MKNPKFIQPVKLSQYPSRNKKELKLIDKKPYSDKDRDKVMNINDCKPLNKMMQGNIILYHGTNKEAGVKIMKEGLRKDIGINPVVFLTSERKIAEKYSGNSNSGVVLKVKVPEEQIKAKIGKITPEVLRHLALDKDVPPHRIKKLKKRK